MGYCKASDNLGAGIEAPPRCVPRARTFTSSSYNVTKNRPWRGPRTEQVGDTIIEYTGVGAFGCKTQPQVHICNHDKAGHTMKI